MGRGALTIAIDAEHLEMVELLVIMSVDTGDALLQAINAEFVEAVELLLEVKKKNYFFIVAKEKTKNKKIILFNQNNPF